MFCGHLNNYYNDWRSYLNGIRYKYNGQLIKKFDLFQKKNGKIKQLVYQDKNKFAFRFSRVLTKYDYYDDSFFAIGGSLDFELPRYHTLALTMYGGMYDNIDSLEIRKDNPVSGRFGLNNRDSCDALDIREMTYYCLFKMVELDDNVLSNTIMDTTLMYSTPVGSQRTYFWIAIDKTQSKLVLVNDDDRVTIEHKIPFTTEYVCLAVSRSNKNNRMKIFYNGMEIYSGTNYYADQMYVEALGIYPIGITASRYNKSGKVKSVLVYGEEHNLHKILKITDFLMS